jgi:hypothetical protein
MSNPTLRHFDSAAGIVVLLLLIVAVISGQSAISSGAQPVADAESWTITRSGERRISVDTSDSSQESVLSLHIVNAGLAPPAAEPVQDLGLRDNRNDRPSAQDD